LDAFFVKKQRKEEESMRKIFLLIVLFTAVITVSACSTEGGFDITSETEIVVGLEAAYAPFNWATPTENGFTVPIANQTGFYADGFDVVMAQEIADALGLTLVIRAIEWDGLIPALLAGEIDLIVAGMSPTSERAQTVAFSDPYFQSEQVMVVRNDGNYADATSLADFTGARVVAQLGTLQDDLIDQITGVNHQAALNDYASLVTALLNNASDAFVAELPVAMGIVAANPSLSYITFIDGNGFTVTPEDVTVSVALRQEDTALLSAINDALNAISTETRNNYMEAALTRQPQ
jgi:ABC-type amino acid transport substrate-binding protein